MIEVRRVSDGGALDFEVVVREGKGVTRHREPTADSRQAHARALYRGRLSLPA